MLPNLRRHRAASGLTLHCWLALESHQQHPVLRREAVGIRLHCWSALESHRPHPALHREATGIRLRCWSALESHRRPLSRFQEASDIQPHCLSESRLRRPRLHLVLHLAGPCLEDRSCLLAVRSFQPAVRSFRLDPALLRPLLERHHLERHWLELDWRLVLAPQKSILQAPVLPVSAKTIRP